MDDGLGGNMVVSVVREKPRGRTRKYQERKDAILASAVSAINVRGIKGMTLADLAASLGLVPTAVTYYFKSKEALAADCFLDAIAAYEKMITTAAEARTARERVGLFLREYFAFCREVAENKATPLTVFNDVRALGNEDVNRAFNDMFRRARALMRATDMPSLDRDAQNVRTHLLLSEIFWIVVWLPNYDAQEFARAEARFEDILSNGLAARGQKLPAQPLLSLDAPSAAHADTTRETFLRAATELINEQGYRGASVDKIAARLAVTKGSFYHHIDAKDDLVLACFERTLEIMQRAQRATDSIASTGLENLASLSRTLVEYQLSSNMPLLRTSALTSVPEQIRLELITRFDRLSHHFAGVISDGIADGSIRPVDANIAAQMLTAMLNAAAELPFWTPGASPQVAADLHVRSLFFGLFSQQK